MRIQSKNNLNLSSGFTLISKACEGFTLIELLVVISVIGILTTMVLVSFGPAQKQARDIQRKSDIKEYQNSLETFANKGNGLYPSRPDAAGVTASSRLCSDLGITTCSEDPKNAADATYVYKYQSDGTVSDGTSVAAKYVLWAKIENSTNYWVNCSNGKVGTKAQTGFSVSGGECPL
jgi:prepilin-type N-terminal cleavage/methylation domain-containing protein